MNKRSTGPIAALPLLGLLALLAGGDVLAASARTNYLQYCSGCHRPTGEGKAPNVPTLHGELGRMVAVPAMRSYLFRVPGAAHTPLSDAELVAVVNWVLMEFNKETLPEKFQPITAEEAARWRQDILADPLRYREEHWGAYDWK
ncbi:MAG: cytochrome c [Pseudohongiellaceae bacterium]